MKKLLLTIVIGFILFLSLIGNVLAQINLSEVIINRPAGLTKVIAAFNSRYKEARETRWYYRNDHYAVTFVMNDLKYNVLYMKNANLIYQISYGNERNIPLKFKRIISKKFRNYDIISAINYQQNAKNMWLVTGEGNKDFLNVKIDGGVIVEEKLTVKHSKR